MPRKKQQRKEIVAKLWQVDVLLSLGRPDAKAIRTTGVPPFTYRGSTTRKAPKGPADDAALAVAIVEPTTRYGRYEYRR